MCIPGKHAWERHKIDSVGFICSQPQALGRDGTKTSERQNHCLSFKTLLAIVTEAPCGQGTAHILGQWRMEFQRLTGHRMHK